MLVRRSTTHSDDQRRGAALVEMALVLPIFLTVVFGIVEFGRAMMVSQMITNSAREGARMAVISGNTNADVEANIHDFLKKSVGLQNKDVTVTITITAGPGNTDPGNLLAKSEAGDIINVNVAIPADKASYIGNSFVKGKSLVGQATMRHE